MNINLVYELNNREYINCVLLERELTRRGHSVKIYNKEESVVLLRGADVTVIPNSYRTDDVNKYRYIFNIGSKLVIVYSCEQVTCHMLPNFFDYSDLNKAKELPHLCWGEDYYQFISSLGYDMKYSQITGAIQLDMCRKEFSSFYSTKKELSIKHHLPFGKKWILFIGDFIYVSEIMVKHISDSDTADITKVQAEHLFEKSTLHELIKWFEQFISTHEDYIIIYRKHPVEVLIKDILELKTKLSDQFFLISEGNIKEWIFNSDRICCWYSTSVVECIVAKKKMALLRPFEFTDDIIHKDYSFYKDYPKLRTYKEFESAIEYGLDDYKDSTLQEVRKLYDIKDKASVFRVADAIEQIHSSWNPDNSESSYQFFLKRWGYLFRENKIIKILIKKTYQTMCSKVDMNIFFRKKRNYACDEWIQSFQNKRNHKMMSKKIDAIIALMVKNEEFNSK